MPMLMLGLTRPTLFERRADWPGIADARRIDLGPLDEDDSRMLADELLKRLPRVPAALRELDHRRRRGQPVLHGRAGEDAGRRGGASRPRRALDRSSRQAAGHATVPQTLTGVLQAGSTACSRRERLRAAAGGGDRVRVLGPGAGRHRPQATAGAARPDASASWSIAHPEAGLEGVREYAFQHQILHQVTYDTVLKRLRRDYHATVAAWLSGPNGRARERLPRHHGRALEQAGDDAAACAILRPRRRACGGPLRARGGDGLRGARSRADGQGSRLDRSASVDKLSLRWRLLDVRERTLDLQGKRPEQRADIAALQALAEMLEDDRRRADVAWRRCDIALRTGDYHTLEDAARQSMALATRRGRRTEAARAAARGICVEHARRTRGGQETRTGGSCVGAFAGIAQGRGAVPQPPVDHRQHAGRPASSISDSASSGC